MRSQRTTSKMKVFVSVCLVLFALSVMGSGPAFSQSEYQPVLEEESPFITVFTSWMHQYNEISVDLWTPDEDVTLTIQNSTGDEIVDPITKTTDGSGWVGFNEEDFGYDVLTAGNTVNVSGDSGERVFIIPSCNVEEVDLDNNIVRGTTDPNEVVVLMIEDIFFSGEVIEYAMQTGPGGEWSFSTSPEISDLTFSHPIEVLILDDDGDRFSLLNVQINPHMIVAASRANYINLRDWEIGSIVTIINDSNEDLNDGFLWMVEILIEESDEHPGMGEYHSWRYDDVPAFEVGDFVTATDGDVTISEAGVTISEGARTKELYVEELYCNLLDAELKIAQGEVPDGLEVSGIILTDTGIYFTETFYGLDGFWNYDLSVFGEDFGDPYYAHFQVFDIDHDNTNAHCYFPVPNTPPEIGEINGLVDPVPVENEILVSVPFTDPDDDIWSTTWDWGDGTSSEGTIDDFVAYGSHAYQESGVYTILVTVSDGTETDTATYEYVVVYDPEGGFVTGGGWIDSPEGAYIPDPTLSGKASFGFVSKYKKGADLPTGNTEFQFRTADLNFKSTSYQWLVIAGKKAMFKGEGEINGQAGYGFMISAVDGDLLGGGGLDLLRIKIWELSTDTQIYDNQLGAPEDADPVTILGSGSIVIHK